MADEIRRRRTRRPRLDKGLTVERGLKFLERDTADRAAETSARLQRYAKYRMWREDQNPASPWAGASDLALSDMMTQSQRVKDTLYNAIIATRPVLLARATSPKDKEKTEVIDAILDYQLLVENGEQWLADLLEDFVDEGEFTVFLPWVKDERYIAELYLLEPIPEEVAVPAEYFLQALKVKFPDMVGVEPRGRTPEDSWDWQVQLQDGAILDVAFYTGEEDRVEMRVSRPQTVFEGPKPIVKDWADVIYPAHSANLQAPGPSNPGGAPHVILVDRPTVDEIERLWRQGRYDMLTKDDIEGLKVGGKFEGENEQQQQKAIIEGDSEIEFADVPGEQKRVTRLLVFDVLQTNKNQPAEDVVYTVIKEKELLCRFRRLSEDFPNTLGRRPFAEQSFIPIKGRKSGISLLEALEASHDAKKAVLDMGVNHGSLLLSPFFFYRPSSSMKPEVIKVFPGEGYPLSDPKNDVNFPTIPPAGQSFAVNAYTLFDREEERVMMIGDFQLGRVPQGKASALRTAQGMAMIAGQGEERPERILRRLFAGLGQIWAMAHDLNRHRLPGEKRVRVALPLDPGEDPYRTVDQKAVDTTVEFEFTANAFNVSRGALQEAITTLAGLLINPVMIQAGVVTADNIYALAKNAVRAWGQNVDEYVSPPSGEVRITAREAIYKIADGQMPMGIPHEGPMRHLQIIQKFVASDLFGFFGQREVQLLQEWIQTVQQLWAEAMQQQALLAGQAGGQKALGPPGQGGGGQRPDSSAPPMEQNEMIDETMPTAGGGGNQGVM